jgi:hypothetical protein
MFQLISLLLQNRFYKITSSIISWFVINLKRNAILDIYNVNSITSVMEEENARKRLDCVNANKDGQALTAQYNLLFSRMNIVNSCSQKD